MNIIQSFNDTMAYIEKTLETGYDEAEIARISGYSYPLFSRLFSILVGYPLNEYLRFRKLSRAAADLRNTDAKIIDIALWSDIIKVQCQNCRKREEERQ